MDDEVLAFDQYRANSKTWKEQLTQLGSGAKVQVLVSRRGQLRAVEVAIGSEPQDKWTLQLIGSPSEALKARMEKWLGPSKK